MPGATSSIAASSVSERRAAGRRAKLRRRIVSIPAVVAVAVLGIVAAPLWLPLAVVVDVVRLRPRLPTVRLGVLVVGFCLLECWALAQAVQLWVRFGFGRRLGSAASLDVHARTQWRWAESVASLARHTTGLRFEIDSPEPLAPGPIVAIGRHASYGDAILPVLLFGAGAGIALRYVLTIGLAWDPALDVFGHRLPNHFVDRTADHAAGELLAIGRLARGMGPGDAAVIFPEGRFFTPQRRERALARLAATDPELAERAGRLRHVLPPMPGGTLALLAAAPGADVVVIGHVGFEGFSRVAELWRNVPLREPVRVRTWRIPAAEVPRGRRERVDWLNEQWQLLDDWIDAQHQNPPTTRPGAAS